MGKKRSPKGKHLLLYGACFLLTLSMSVGCAAFLNFQKQRQAQAHLDLAESLINKGDYQGALKENEAGIRLCPSASPGDIALFRIGLIWAHPDNPRRDYKKALESFRRVLHDFPRSALKQEIGALTGALQELNRREDRIRELEETVGGLKERLKELKEIDIRLEQRKREELP